MSAWLLLELVCLFQAAVALLRQAPAVAPGLPSQTAVPTATGAAQKRQPLLGAPGGRPLAAVGAPQKQLLALPQSERLRSVLPLAWVHVPKCGSSFGNVLIDMPGMCPGIPLNETINREEYGEHELGWFTYRWDVLGDGCGRDKLAKWGMHMGMGNTTKYEKTYKGHAVGFFRQPEQRIVSGYHHGYHDWFDLKVRAPTMAQYRARVEGCATKVLARKAGPLVCNGKPVTKREAVRATTRLREGFVFVGITEKWQASICAFHAMFGGPCRRTDFMDNRLGDAATPHRVYDAAAEGLAGYKDAFDGYVYQEALAIWRAQLEMFNVSQASCASCLKEAGVSPRPDEW